MNLSAMISQLNHGSKRGNFYRIWKSLPVQQADSSCGRPEQHSATHLAFKPYVRTESERILVSGEFKSSEFAPCPLGRGCTIELLV